MSVRRLLSRCARLPAHARIVASTLATRPSGRRNSSTDISTLPNGLTVVLEEDHSVPIVHVNLTYHVGSKNEKAGTHRLSRICSST